MMERDADSERSREAGDEMCNGLASYSVTRDQSPIECKHPRWTLEEKEKQKRSMRFANAEEDTHLDIRAWETPV
ncbi:unnamed protein product [Arctogadus glacialis]